jgi:peptide deformylase
MKSKLITLPNPKLRQPSNKVGIITDNIKSIIKSMKETTLNWEQSREHEVGVALAAVQIGELLKIVIIREDSTNKENQQFLVFINPEITKYEGDIVEDYEGCLSIKDIYGKVPRYSKVRIKALDENGKQIKLTAEGFLARIFQHEIDHTKGIVFIDHIKDNPNAFYNLSTNGDLTPKNYEKDVKNNSILW